MKADEEVIYWIDEEFEEWSFRAIDDNQNFYFSKDGNIIIVFDKYEVGVNAFHVLKNTKTWNNVNEVEYYEISEETFEGISKLYDELFDKLYDELIKK